MGTKTEISWTDHTFNPWWGCQRVSPGCEKCYAETFANRLGLKVWGPTSDRRFFGADHWHEPLKWNLVAARAGVRRRVFCASMADVFEYRRDLDEHRARLWTLIALTPHLDWLLLTKRPQNMLTLTPVTWRERWPTNVWAGTTCEDQRRAEDRIRHLLAVPAVVRFLSVEPQLGRVDLRPFMGWVFRDGIKPNPDGDPFSLPAVGGSLGVNWVIVGGESGAKARPFDLSWAYSIRDQCATAGVPFFYKQGGGAHACPHSTKGGCQACMPEDLRVREFPSVPK